MGNVDDSRNANVMVTKVDRLRHAQQVNKVAPTYQQLHRELRVAGIQSHCVAQQPKVARGYLKALTPTRADTLLQKMLAMWRRTHVHNNGMTK